MRTPFTLFSHGIIPRLSSRLNSDFDDIALETDDAAFVIAVAGGPGAADDGITGVLQISRQFVHLLFASDRKGNMGISCGTDEELRDIIRAYFLNGENAMKEQIHSLYK